VGDVVLFGDTTRSPELRHEVPLSIPDPFLYVERDGLRHVVVVSLELPLLEQLGGYVLHPFEEFGLDELRRSSGSQLELLSEIVVRAVTSFGVEQALVPASFPIFTADRLRAAGVEVCPSPEEFVARRRVKSGFELAGIRRAQAAAEAGMGAARDLLRRSSAAAGGVLELDGAPLRSEQIKAAISATFTEHGCSADLFVVSHGEQAAIGHHAGAGEIRAGEPVVVDLWPRDNASSCWADMTRTFVVGEVDAELAEWHALCREALGRALAAVRPGVSGKELYDTVCDLFEAAGYPTQRTKADGETLERGFHHALGHGVGLEVHELPLLNLLGKEPLLAGDVLAIEPGLYRPGFGGLRLEDLVLVTGEGCENLTSFPYDLEP
jgi:Xaa-Pro aminopeptidase